MRSTAKIGGSYTPLPGGITLPQKLLPRLIYHSSIAAPPSKAAWKLGHASSQMPHSDEHHGV